MYLFYSTLITLLGICRLPRLLWRSLHNVTYRQELGARLGYRLPQPVAHRAIRHGLWFHAASVGEIQGLQPIITALHNRLPTLPIIVSTFTATGRATAQRVLPEAASVFLMPPDIAWVMRRLMRHLQPYALIIQETELWPHLLRAASQQRVPVAVVNGRLSPRAFARYRWGLPFMRRVLASVSLVLAQSPDNASRFQHLGLSSERIRVTGNTNIDRALLAAERLAESHPLAPLLYNKRLWVGGSTHEGEETALLHVYRQLHSQHPDLCLLLAPRHLERIEAVVRHVQTAGYRVLRRSQYDTHQPQTLEPNTVLILDTLGELATLYRLCTIAFVGGSLTPIGGHNILEPAVYAKPVLFGPHMQHFPELAALLCEGGGAIQVQDESDLYQWMTRILAQPEEGRRIGTRARCTLAANRGALDRTMQALTKLLTQHATNALTP